MIEISYEKNILRWFHFLRVPGATDNWTYAKFTPHGRQHGEIQAQSQRGKQDLGWDAVDSSDPTFCFSWCIIFV